MGRELGVIGEIDLVDDSFTLNLDISVNVKLLARAVETSGRDTELPCAVFYLRFKIKKSDRPFYDKRAIAPLHPQYRSPFPYSQK